MTGKDSNGCVPEDICLTCGLCCNGAIFADVVLQPGDDLGRLESAGLTFLAAPGQRVPTGSRNRRFSQPCAAFDGCQCRIYSERPRHCQKFECLLLKGVKAGVREKKEALSIIRGAREQADKVWRLLRELGDTDEELALKTRFERTTRRLDQSGWDNLSAGVYGELTLALHALNVILSENFYQ